jgi:NTP pyrophosphatase (non-canonical NTP hydrolase)
VFKNEGMGMDIKQLTEAMHNFVSAKGWYDPESPRPQTPRNIAISLSLEAAEVLEHFQWSESSAAPDELAGELADVALYLLQLSSITGIDLGKAVLDKLQKNYTRTWDQPGPDQPEAQL